MSSFKLFIILILINNLRIICSEVYNETNTSIVSRVDILCEDDYDCQDLDICVSGVCRCANDYRLEGEQCRHFVCVEDFECQTYDENRVCAQDKYKPNSSSCVCSSHYEFVHDKRLCQFKDNQLIWLLVLALLPLLLMLMSCWYCYKTANSKNNLEESIQPEPQTPQIIITDLQSLQSYPNLNELFMSSPKVQRFESSNGSFDSNDNKVISEKSIDPNGLDAIKGDQRVGFI